MHGFLLSLSICIMTTIINPNQPGGGGFRPPCQFSSIFVRSQMLDKAGEACANKYKLIATRYATTVQWI